MSPKNNDISSRHSKIAGNFGENLALFWLSKHGFECALVDHVGIDIIAVKDDEKIGVSVKSRTHIKSETAKASVDLYRNDFDKADKTCKIFGCNPYFAIVVDETSVGGILSMFIVPLQRAKELMGFLENGPRKRVKHPNWRMRPESIQEYRKDKDVLAVEFVSARKNHAQEVSEWWKNHSRPESSQKE